jgi:hypothetical protein
MMLAKVDAALQTGRVREKVFENATDIYIPIFSSV